MARYSRGGRRSGGAAWQWVVIGIILGFGCSAVVVLALLTLGVLGINPGTGLAFGASPTPIVITATPAPVTPTDQPSPTPQVEPTTDTSAAVVQPPAASPTSAVIVAPTATPQIITATPEASPTPESVVPPQLQTIGSDMVAVPGATFLMGTTPQEVQNAVRECQERDGGNCELSYGEDAYPQHEVTLDPYLIETTEVTYGQYLAFLNYLGPRSHLNGCGGFPCLATQNEEPNSFVQFDSVNYSVIPALENRPVSLVTWYGAQAYCEALGRRLPTEAEWEHAARGPENLLYPWGNDWQFGLAKTNRPDPADIGAVDARSFAVSRGFGLYEISGNLAEWVFDYYDERYYSQSAALNPQGPAVGTDRVVRGGSWNTPPFFARLVHRQHWRPDDPELWIGFRCAADDPGAAAGTGVDSGAGSSGVPGAGTGVEEVQPGGSGVDNAAPTIPAPPTLPATSTPPPQPTSTIAPGG